jgi:hypothetical protein
MNFRKEIRSIIKEQFSRKEEAKKREKVWSCIEYFASGNYNELADYEFSNEELIKQAKDYIKGNKYQEFLKCCEKTLKEQKFENDTAGWYMDGEGGWADIPLLKGHLDSSFVGIHNDGTYFFDTEDPSERSGDILSFRGFSEVLHRLGLKVDAHKVSDQLYKISPQRLKLDLIEADISLWEQKKQIKYAIMQSAFSGDKVSLDTARFLRKGSREIWWTTKKSDALLFNTKSQAKEHMENNNIDTIEPLPKIVAIKKSIKEQKAKDLIHSYQDWKDSVRGVYGVGIRLVLTADSSKTLVFQANKKVLGKQLSAYYDHIEQVGYIERRSINESGTDDLCSWPSITSFESILVQEASVTREEYNKIVDTIENVLQDATDLSRQQALDTVIQIVHEDIGWTTPKLNQLIRILFSEYGD